MEILISTTGIVSLVNFTLAAWDEKWHSATGWGIVVTLCISIAFKWLC